MQLAPSAAPAGSGTIDPARTRMVQELRHNSPLFSCRFDPTGRYIFAGAQDNTIQRWELASGQKTALAGHRSWIRGLDFVAARGQLISGSYDGNVVWWQVDAATPTPLRILEAHRGWVRAVSVSPDGTTLATCGNDNLVKLWSVENGTLIRELSGHTSHVYNVAYLPDGQF